MMDLNLIEQGEEYRKLKDSYVIFICNFDPFGRNRQRYYFEHVCQDEKDLFLKDGTARIFLNAKGTCRDTNSKPDAFLRYVAGQLSNDTFVKRLVQAVAKAKKNRKWRREYMTLAMRDRENRELGKLKGLQQVAQNMKKQGYSIEQIAQVTEVSTETVFEWLEKSIQ